MNAGDKESLESKLDESAGYSPIQHTESADSYRESDGIGLLTNDSDSEQVIKSPVVRDPVVFDRLTTTDSDSEEHSYGLGWARKPAAGDLNLSDTFSEYVDNGINPDKAVDDNYGDVRHRYRTSELSGRNDRERIVDRSSHHVRLQTYSRQRASHSSLLTKKDMTPLRPNSTHLHSKNMITYMNLIPHSVPFAKILFEAYYPYVMYWSCKRPMMHLVLGILFGDPPLDLQIIHAALEIVRWKNSHYNSFSRWRRTSCDLPPMKWSADNESNASSIAFSQDVDIEMSNFKHLKKYVMKFPCFSSVQKMIYALLVVYILSLLLFVISITFGVYLYLCN
jgi:hypothetical protein